MIIDPELREAHQAIRDLPTNPEDKTTYATSINELASVTMLLLQTVDHIQHLQAIHVTDTQEHTRQIARLRAELSKLTQHQ